MDVFLLLISIEKTVALNVEDCVCDIRFVDETVSVSLYMTGVKN